MKSAIAAAALAASLLAAPAARAAAILDLTGAGPGETATCGSGCGSVSGATFGWAFQVTSPVTLGALAIWDEAFDGIGAPVTASLWSDTGTLLASVEVSDTSEARASAFADAGGWLAEDLAAPLTLAPGTYALGATLFDETVVRLNPDISLIPEIGFLFPVWADAGSDSGVLWPDSLFLAGVFGVTAFTVTGSPGAEIPLPPTVLTLLGGLAALGALARRRAP